MIKDATITHVEPHKTSEIVIISNRLPIQRVKRGRVSVWEVSPGGLVSALRPILRESSCTWVGWVGESAEEVHPFDHEGIHNLPVPLSSAEVKSFYEGFSNRIIWPLYHDAIRAPEYRQTWWQPYINVNRRFAEAAAAAAQEEGTVWVQDYQLQIVPSILRSLRRDLLIGFFMHIPFPPLELFAQLPWRRDILEAIIRTVTDDTVGTFLTSFDSRPSHAC